MTLSTIVTVVIAVTVTIIASTGIGVDIGVSPTQWSGWASQYAPGRMEAVIENRQNGCWGRYNLPVGLPAVDGYIAVRERDDIGQLFYLRPVDADKWELFLAVDCASYADGSYGWMNKFNVLVEVDYPTAVRWDTVGRGIKIEMKRYVHSSKHEFIPN